MGDSCSGDGLWDRAARSCVTRSSWELCWLSALAGPGVNPACSSPTQPPETASTRSQAPHWFCLKKIREHYQQRTDRQSSSAEWKINWSGKTATCCSCLLSERTVSEHFSAACHDKQSREDSTEPSPAAAPGLKEDLKVSTCFSWPSKKHHIYLCPEATITATAALPQKRGWKLLLNQDKDWGLFPIHAQQKASSPADRQVFPPAAISSFQCSKGS